MQVGRWSQAGGCKQSVRGRQREAQAACHTCKNAGGQELLSSHTSRLPSRKARTGRQAGKSSQLRQVGMQARIQAGVEVGGHKEAGSTGRQGQLGRQKRQGSTVREVSAHTEVGRREGGRQAEAHRGKQVRGLQVNTGKPQAAVGR
jgi:hypothetical protein